MEKGLIDGAEWRFFKSSNTGKIGPSGPLQEFLENAGIDVIKNK